MPSGSDLLFLIRLPKKIMNIYKIDNYNNSPGAPVVLRFLTQVSREMAS